MKITIAVNSQEVQIDIPGHPDDIKINLQGPQTTCKNCKCSKAVSRFALNRKQSVPVRYCSFPHSHLDESRQFRICTLFSKIDKYDSEYLNNIPSLSDEEYQNRAILNL